MRTQVLCLIEIEDATWRAPIAVGKVGRGALGFLPRLDGWWEKLQEQVLHLLWLDSWWGGGEGWTEQGVTEGMVPREGGKGWAEDDVASGGMCQWLVIRVMELYRRRRPFGPAVLVDTMTSPICLCLAHSPLNPSCPYLSKCPLMIMICSMR